MYLPVLQYYYVIEDKNNLFFVGFKLVNYFYIVILKRV